MKEIRDRAGLKCFQPETAEEWQDAVNASEFWMRFDAARQYGLVVGGPAIDITRCRQLLEEGKALGYAPNVGWTVSA